MFELTGKYTTAKIFSETQEPKAVSQIFELLNQPFVAGKSVRIMPDYHAGAGCVIGFTADLGDKVIPNIVGVDLGCGMLVYELGLVDFDLEKLDRVIHERVPNGKNSHKKVISPFNTIQSLRCYNKLKHQGIFELQIGTLGGGNHFIEVSVDEFGFKYLVIHSGSRNVGKQVADYYQDVAIESCKELGDINKAKKEMIASLKEQGREKQIQGAIEAIEYVFSGTQPKYPRDLCFLQGDAREDYLHDMRICQKYASINRQVMATIILNSMSLEYDRTFETVHNYVSDDGMIRKGAVSAKAGEKLIIPINMRDGSLICKGKGNPDWNFSAPHGAGRLMGRGEAKRTLNMAEFKTQMEGVFSSTINESTLDEAPGAYKPMSEIVDAVQDTVTIMNIIKPIYNFKAGE